MAKQTTNSATKKRLPRIWVIVAACAAVAAVAGGGGYWYWQSRQAADTAASAATVQTATVRRGSIVLSASGTGTLTPRAEATFGFNASGQVAELSVKVGDLVEAGQLLAKLDDTSAQLASTQAKRALDELFTSAAIYQAKLDVANDDVAAQAARDALAYLISPNVLYWEEQVEKAQAELDAAKTAAQTTPTVDAAARVAAAEKALKNAQTGLRIAQSYYKETYLPDHFTYSYIQGRNRLWTIVPPSPAEIASARAAYALAQQTLKEDQDYLTALTTGVIPEGATGAKITALEEAQQAVATAQDNLDATHLVAPIAGTITTLGFGLGDQVGSSSTITIQDLAQPYTVELYLDESDWSNIQVGYPVEVVFDILPDVTLKGNITRVDPALTSEAGSLYIHAVVLLTDRLPGSLPAGTGATVDVIGGQREDAVLVPVEALREICRPGSTRYS